MLTDYSNIAILLICAILFVVIAIGLPVILRRSGVVQHKPNALKYNIYECGMDTTGKTWIQFNLRYYFYALIFLTLDVMVAFLYPWAVELKNSGTLAFASILFFILIAVIGYVYAWKNGALEWE
ncbi:MAG: NADH-quinone oxidoreductase subunit A [Dehalococcoidales bacterium]|nr:NADH-quinone oxidoreductase subunit A [Dehalococcoidales bacterium]